MEQYANLFKKWCLFFQSKRQLLFSCAIAEWLRGGTLLVICQKIDQKMLIIPPQHAISEYSI